jgi:hypothetical protein
LYACNNPGKSDSNIYVITPKEVVNLELPYNYL